MAENYINDQVVQGLHSLSDSLSDCINKITKSISDVEDCCESWKGRLGRNEDQIGKMIVDIHDLDSAASTVVDQLIEKVDTVADAAQKYLDGTT